MNLDFATGRLIDLLESDSRFKLTRDGPSSSDYLVARLRGGLWFDTVVSTVTLPESGLDDYGISVEVKTRTLLFDIMGEDLDAFFKTHKDLHEREGRVMSRVPDGIGAEVFVLALILDAPVHGKASILSSIHFLLKHIEELEGSIESLFKFEFEKLYP
jgi:hypothetical protein